MKTYEGLMEMISDKNLDLKIISCTQAGGILNKSKQDVKEMVLDGTLKNFGNEHRFMVNQFDLFKKVSWFDYSQDKLFTEEITIEQLKWLQKQKHIEIDQVD